MENKILRVIPRRILYVLLFVTVFGQVFLFLYNSTAVRSRTRGSVGYHPSLLYLSANESIPNMAEVDEKAFLDTRKADALFKDVRIFCVILTMANYTDRLEAVNSTWARRCNKHIYVMKTSRTGSDILNVEFKETRPHLILKTRAGIKYMYKNHIEEFDWLYKADDDSYVVMENLRYLLSHYDPKKIGYLGYHLAKFFDAGYMDGGAGYVLSNAAVRHLVQNGYNKHICPPLPLHEDVDTAKCLDKVGITALSSLDAFGRETFQQEPPQKILRGPVHKYRRIFARMPPRLGVECCSRFLISFHHVPADDIIIMDHLLYRTSVYGRVQKSDLHNIYTLGEVPKFDNTSMAARMKLYKPKKRKFTIVQKDLSGNVKQSITV